MHVAAYISLFLFTFTGAPLLYMGLCVPLGFTLYSEADYGYGYVQVTNSTQDNETTTQQTAVWVWVYVGGYSQLSNIVRIRKSAVFSEVSWFFYWVRSVFINVFLGIIFYVCLYVRYGTCDSIHVPACL